MMMGFTKTHICIETTEAILSSMPDMLTEVVIMFTFILDGSSWHSELSLKLYFDSTNWLGKSKSSLELTDLFGTSAGIATNWHQLN
jgi:hypothetical protein